MSFLLDNLQIYQKSVSLQCVFHSIRFKVNKGWSTAVLLFLCPYLSFLPLFFMKQKNPLPPHQALVTDSSLPNNLITYLSFGIFAKLRDNNSLHSLVVRLSPNRGAVSRWSASVQIPDCFLWLPDSCCLKDSSGWFLLIVRVQIVYLTINSVQIFFFQLVCTIFASLKDEINDSLYCRKALCGA